MKKCAKCLIVLFLGLQFVFFAGVTPVRGIEDSWTTMASMPTDRMGFGVAVVNGKIYSIGGWNEISHFLNRNEEYDPVNDTWVTKAPMPTRRCYCGVAAWQNRIYVFGGTTETENATAKVEVYDPLTDSWNTTLTPMPTAREWLSANVVNDRIYLLGGESVAGKILNTNEVYYPSSDSWTSETPLPTPSWGYSSVVADGKIFVFFNQTNQIYNALNHTWIDGVKVPEPLVWGSAGATTGAKAPKRIYLLGGSPSGDYSDKISLNQVYDPDLDAWTTGTPMPTARCLLSVAVVDDVLYALGGNWPTIAKNERYVPFGYIPEFLPFIVLPFFIVSTLLAVMVYKGKNTSKVHCKSARDDPSTH